VPYVTTNKKLDQNNYLRSICQLMGRSANVTFSLEEDVDEEDRLCIDNSNSIIITSHLTTSPSYSKYPGNPIQRTSPIIGKKADLTGIWTRYTDPT